MEWGNLIPKPFRVVSAMGNALLYWCECGHIEIFGSHRTGNPNYIKMANQLISDMKRHVKTHVH